jgi:hypothetical protein
LFAKASREKFLPVPSLLAQGEALSEVPRNRNQQEGMEHIINAM